MSQPAAATAGEYGHLSVVAPDLPDEAAAALAALNFAELPVEPSEDIADAAEVLGLTIFDDLCTEAGIGGQTATRLAAAMGKITGELSPHDGRAMVGHLRKLARLLRIAEIQPVGGDLDIDVHAHSGEARVLRPASRRGGIFKVAEGDMFDAGGLQVEGLSRFAVSVPRVPDFRRRKSGHDDRSGATFDFAANVAPAFASQVLKAIMLEGRDADDAAVVQRFEIIDRLSDFQVCEVATLVACAYRVMQHAPNHSHMKLDSSFQQFVSYLGAIPDQDIAAALARLSGGAPGRWHRHVSRARAAVVTRLGNIQSVIEDIIDTVGGNPDLRILEPRNNRPGYTFSALGMTWLKAISDMPFNPKTSQLPYANARAKEALRANLGELLNAYRKLQIAAAGEQIERDVAVISAHLSGLSTADVAKNLQLRESEVAGSLKRFVAFVSGDEELEITLANVPDSDLAGAVVPAGGEVAASAGQGEAVRPRPALTEAEQRKADRNRKIGLQLARAIITALDAPLAAGLRPAGGFCEDMVSGAPNARVQKPSRRLTAAAARWQWAAWLSA